MPSVLDVPDWLKEHPDLLARDIKLHQAIKPFGSLYYRARPASSTIPQYVVKFLNPATEEGPMSERLQDNPSSPNHGLPSEIIPSEPRLLVMPFVGDIAYLTTERGQQASSWISFIRSLKASSKYLHRLQIAHLVICFANIAYAIPFQASTDERLVARKVYIIDFHTSRQPDLGPGRQPPIVLPQSQEKKLQA